MASIIRIKRSSGTNKPASLNWGELAYVTGIGSYGGVNQYKDRIFLGDDGENVNPVGGYYYTSMMEHQAGSVSGVTNTRNQDGGIVVVLDSNRKVDQWNVDNLRLDGNTFSSQNTDGDIVLDPNGTGEINVVDDTYLSFGTDKDVKLRYDELTDNRFEITGADWNFANNVAISINDTTSSTNTTTGALTVTGGVGIVSDVYIGGILNVTGNLQVDGNTTLGNSSTDVVTITGSINHTGLFTNTGGARIDNIGIKSNIISTKSGSGNVIYIDPYPDGLSNEGLVIVKGNLQVDGTTTTVDSSSVTVNGSIISLGDVTSNRTVVVAVASGVSTITLDSVVGINTGDIISGSAALSNSGLSTITAYNTSTKIVTITGTTISGITSTTQLIVTHAYDTNTDRGIAFDYNTGVGLANQKTGFFGYDDSTGYFTYIPDATISNSVVVGTKGTLDVGALYLNFNTSGISTRGSAYFDTNGKLTSTNSPEVGTASTSNLILTTMQHFEGL
jgi:hypothetical protein